MPYKNDPRRTITLNFHPDEYAALAEDALDAGYATPGTYALALVRARGDAPAPIPDQRSADRLARLEGANEWLQQQFEALQVTLKAAGVPFQLAKGPGGGPRPRSWAAQQREVEQAVAEALARDRARRKRQAAQRAASDPTADPGAA